ncbi:radical SAM protein [Micromonosporaceae bacterium B7E4]
MTPNAMSAVERPTTVTWDLTYACPLRCTHCYSESGRRPSRQLSQEDLLRVADALISLRPGGVSLTGGEPMLVPGITAIAERLSRAGIEVFLYTSGWRLGPEMVEELTDVVTQVNVSVDGATPEVHDRIRGRAGSFARAMEALAVLDTAAGRRRARGGPPLRFGIDCVVTRSNFHQMDDLCRVVAPRFPELRFVWFGAVVPSGLASRPGFEVDELLTDDQVRLLDSSRHRRHLRSLAPPSVEVVTTDNRAVQMHPDQVGSGGGFRAMLVEPDGGVRAMPMYEGTVGNLLTEDPETLWERAVARWSDPFVVATLSPVRTMRQWAEATRRIDHHFGSDQVRARIDRRPAYRP